MVKTEPQKRALEAVKKQSAQRSKKKNVLWKYWLWGGASIGVCLAGALAIFLYPEQGVEKLVNDRSLVEHVNNVQKGSFTVGPVKMFEDWTLRDIKTISGINLSNEASTIPTCITPEDIEIPELYDPRDVHPHCFPKVSKKYVVYTSGNCTSAWATAPVSSMATRLCIDNPTIHKDLRLSVKDVLACDTKGGGCEGGYLDEVFNHMRFEGVVPEECMEYANLEELKCEEKCVDMEPIKTGPPCLVSNSQQLQRELVSRGPVAGLVFIHDDFLIYKSGVYEVRPTSTRLLDKSKNYLIHAVKIIGFGKENNKKYWLIENSWGDDWGMGGFGKISRDEDKSVLVTTFLITGDPVDKAAGMEGESDASDKFEKLKDLLKGEMDDEEMGSENMEKLRDLLEDQEKMEKLRELLKERTEGADIDDADMDSEGRTSEDGTLAEEAPSKKEFEEINEASKDSVTESEDLAQPSEDEVKEEVNEV